jgi:hypothetical protein
MTALVGPRRAFVTHAGLAIDEPYNHCAHAAKMKTRLPPSPQRAAYAGQ